MIAWHEDCRAGKVKFRAAWGSVVERTEKFRIFAYQSLMVKGFSDESEEIVGKGFVAIG